MSCINISVIPAPGIAEIRHRGQLGLDRRTSKPTLVEVCDCLLGVLLGAEADVHVANEMLAQVVAHVELLDRPVLVPKLDKNILVELVVVLLQLAVGDGAPCQSIMNTSHKDAYTLDTDLGGRQQEPARWRDCGRSCECKWTIYRRLFSTSALVRHTGEKVGLLWRREQRSPCRHAPILK